MIITPTSSFTNSISPNKFPTLELYFHADDFTNGATDWTDRIAGITANFNGPAVKDSGGIYTMGTNSVTSVFGTMPTINAEYIVAVAIGYPQTTSSTAGVNVIFGNAAGGCGFQALGINHDGTSARNSSPTLTAPATVGQPACQLSLFDCVDTTSPVVRRIFANTGTTDAISNSTATTTNTAAFTIGTIASACTFSALAAVNDGRRGKIYALFSFSSASVPSTIELQVAAAEMARTQQLYAGWFNKV